MFQKENLFLIQKALMIYFFCDYIPYKAWINMNDYKDVCEMIIDKVKDSNGTDYTVVASIYAY